MAIPYTGDEELEGYKSDTVPRLEKAIRLVYQKIDAPPHAKACGLNGARFLDAQSVTTH